MRILVVIGFSCAIAAVLARPQHKKGGKPTPPPHPHGGADGPYGGPHRTQNPSNGGGSSEEGDHHDPADNCHPNFTYTPFAPFESSPGPSVPDSTDDTNFSMSSIEPETDFQS